MLLWLPTIALLSLFSLSLAASEPAKSTPEKHADVKQRLIKRKEICYRNVFGDEDLPEPKCLKPVLTEDGNRKQVWYSDGVKEDEYALELYYEEFCYRHYKKEGEELKGSSTARTATPTNTGAANFVKVSFFAGYEEKPVTLASLDDDSRENLANNRPFKHTEHDSDKADMLGFFMNFQTGYPGQDKCDEHGCWERRKVPAQAPEGYAETMSTVQVTVQADETAASTTSSETSEVGTPTATATKARDEL
ncbi:hypothetical protein JCM10296v2_001434 [Rhodotorula toruloides]